MRLLLDTHVFLWYITADPKLPATFRAASQDPANEVFLSVASVSSSGPTCAVLQGEGIEPCQAL
jgi:hypothetical protein